jgi:tetratricopeptide (TPR) repeat protein
MKGPETSFLVAVEDNFTADRILERLRDMGFFHVIRVTDGYAAIKVLDRAPEQFLVASWELAGSSGPEVLAALRGRKASRHQPAIFIGTPPSGPQLALARQLGVDAILLGAFNQDAFEEKVARVIPPLDPGQAWPEELADELEDMLQKGHLDKALELQERLMDQTRRRAAGMKTEIGLLLLEKGEPEEAAVMLEEAVTDLPTLPRAHAGLARACLELGQMEKAIRASERAMALDPANPDHPAVLGECLMAAGDFERAESVFSQLLSQYPSDLHFVNRLAMALRRQGKWEPAIGLYQKALTQEDGDEHLYFNLGRTYFEIRRWTEARQALNRALTINPGFREARGLLQKIPG